MPSIGLGKIDQALFNKLQLSSINHSSFIMLESGGQKAISSSVQQETDRNSFLDTMKALKTLKCSDDDVRQIWILLACVLHLSNIEYTDPTNNITSTIRNNSIHLGKVDPQRPVEISCPSLDIDVLASLLGCPSIEGFIQAVVTQRIKIPGRSSIRLKLLSVIQCQNNITSLIKWIYSQLFNWLVKKINLALASYELDMQGYKVSNDTAFIGILDIFGFEILSINSFEQLCINLTNERLQQCFNETVFIMEQDMYKQEGLNWHEIQFHNNQPVIDLISNKKKELPLGLLPIIEEFSKLNRKPDDLQLLNSFHQYHETSLTSPTSAMNRRLSLELSRNVLYARSRRVPNGFVVRHFAGDVHYTITGFLEKNNDSLQTDLLLLLSCSTNDFLRKALGIDDQLASSSTVSSSPLSSPVRKTSINNKIVIDSKKLSSSQQQSTSSTITSSSSVSTQFRNQLDTLLSTLSSTAQHYVKCIKPNSNKASKDFNPRLVTEQLKYNGVLEIVRIRRDGYSIRLSFIEFYQTYEVILLVATSDGEDVELNQSIPNNVRLLRGTASKLTSNPRDMMIARTCTAFIAKYSLQPTDYQMGKSLIFMKDSCLSTLQAKLRLIFNLTSIIIQARVRAYLITKKYQHIISNCRLIQSYYRTYVLKIRYKRIVRSIKMIQRYYRTYLIRCKYLQVKLSIIMIQKISRKFFAQKRYQWFRFRKYAAIKLQSCFRKHLSVLNYRITIMRIIILQSWIRKVKIRRKYLQCRSSIVRLQSKLRSYLCQRLYRHHLDSVVLLQSNIRSLLVRTKRKKISSIIQRQKEEARVAFITHKVVLIQAWIRMIIISRKYEQLVLVRKEEWIRQQDVLYKLKHKSCLLIQRNYRITLLKKRLKLLKINSKLTLLRQISSINIQRIVRGLLCRLFVGRYIHSMQVLIRRLYCYTIRRRFLKIRNSRLYRIHYIQSWMKMILVRRLYRKQLRSIRSIQFFLRSKRLRLRYLKYPSAIIKIQRIVRGYLMRFRFLSKMLRWKAHVLSSEKKVSAFIYKCHRNVVSYSFLIN